MMRRTLTMAWAAFFCLYGWVYAAGMTLDANDAYATRCDEEINDPLANVFDDGGKAAAAAAAGKAEGEAAKPAPAPVAEDKEVPTKIDGITVSKFNTVSLSVKNQDLRAVLQLLGIQSKQNIVVGNKVQGSVTVNLFDVTFEQALEAVLHQNGCGYEKRDNVINVDTLEELAKRNQVAKRIETRIFTLSYITAQDARSFIEPLLSAAGKIEGTKAADKGFKPSDTDAGANSSAHDEVLMVRDVASNVEEIAKVIDKLDTKPQQVLVEATILQADLSEDLALGVDVSILGSLALDTFANPLSAVDKMLTGAIQNTPSGAATTSVGGVATGKSGIKVGVLTKNAAVFIRALDSVTDTTILANPKIMALNRQKAFLQVGEKIGYLSTTSTATSTTQTVQFLNTGTELSFRPFVGKDGFIRIELRPKVSSATTRDITAGSSIVTIPDEDTQELITNVIVKDGQTVVLGGLFKEETTVKRSQVPYLGDLPGIGLGFKGRDDTTVRSEVIFLITPHIVKDRAIAIAGAATLDSIQMMHAGARESLLPWSKTKLSASHLRSAMEFYSGNQMDKAMWEVDMALGAEPRMVEALRLKERMAGHRLYVPRNNMLEETVSMMVDQQRGAVTQPLRPLKPTPGPGGMLKDRPELEKRIPEPVTTEGVRSQSIQAPAEDKGAKTPAAPATPPAPAKAPGAAKPQPMPPTAPVAAAAPKAQTPAPAAGKSIFTAFGDGYYNYFVRPASIVRVPAIQAEAVESEE